MFNFVIQLQYVVMEKERRLRDAMGQQGMRKTAHWAAWFIVCELSNLVVCCILVIVGHTLRMELFVENEFALYFAHFMLTTTALTLWAFVCSTFLMTQDAARTFGIFWYMLTFVIVPVASSIVFPMTKTQTARDAKQGLGAIAAFPFFVALDDFIMASSDVSGFDADGLNWSERFNEDGPGYSKMYSVDDAFVWLLRCCCIYAVLTWCT